MSESQPLLYLLYAVNGIAGLALGLFLYREYHEGFMVVLRDRVLSLKWFVVPLLLLVSLLNLFWLYKVRGLDQDLLLLLLMFSGLSAPFVWMATVALGRFILLDVLMGFLGEVSESFSGIHQQVEQWMQKRDLEEIHQHDDRMEKIRKVRRQWSKRSISRKDAVKKISGLQKEEKKKKRSPKKREKPAASRRQREESGDKEMPGLMSGFIDKMLDEKDPK